MDSGLEQIRQQQKQAWNKFSGGWRKWDEFNMEFLKPIGVAMMSSLHLKDTDSVLDVAAGTGEPGLSIAGIVTSGKVVGTDLSEDMLAIAHENAVKRGIRNFTTQVCDVCELPFADNSFDAVSCRLGFMFFPDMLLAAKEMVRVLKPGGRLAASVWHSLDKNPWISTAMNVINSNMEIPASDPAAPGMFRCAQQGLVAGLLKQAGLKDVEEQYIREHVNFRSTEFYWGCMTEVISMVVMALAKADDRLKEKIRTEVFATVDKNYPEVKIPFESIVISGKK